MSIFDSPDAFLNYFFGHLAFYIGHAYFWGAALVLVILLTVAYKRAQFTRDWHESRKH